LNEQDPRRIAGYRVLARLGAGGMGQVFLGRSPGGRRVALKVVRPELADDPEFRARFAREVSAARTVSGIFTAAVLDADPQASPPWLATEYVPGPSLSEFVRSHGPLPAFSVRMLAAGLAEALAAVHAAGVVHRDLKPSNVLLDAEGPRLIDFGISKAAEASVLTRTGMVVGSPGFMSPEQIEGRPSGAPSDVFSLGAVLSYASTGAGPFGEGSTPALLYRVVHAEPELDRIPAELRELVAACLRKDPAERPTPAEILERAQAEGGIGPAEDQGGWLPDSLTAVVGQHSADPAGDLRAGRPTPSDWNATGAAWAGLAAAAGADSRPGPGVADAAPSGGPRPGAPGEAAGTPGGGGLAGSGSGASGAGSGTAASGSGASGAGSGARPDPRAVPLYGAAGAPGPGSPADSTPQGYSSAPAPADAREAGPGTGAASATGRAAGTAPVPPVPPWGDDRSIGASGAGRVTWGSGSPTGAGAGVPSSEALTAPVPPVTPGGTQGPGLPPGRRTGAGAGVGAGAAAGAAGPAAAAAWLGPTDPTLVGGPLPADGPGASGGPVPPVRTVGAPGRRHAARPWWRGRLAAGAAVAVAAAGAGIGVALAGTTGPGSQNPGVPAPAAASTGPATGPASATSKAAEPGGGASHTAPGAGVRHTASATAGKWSPGAGSSSAPARGSGGGSSTSASASASASASHSASASTSPSGSPTARSSSPSAPGTSTGPSAPGGSGPTSSAPTGPSTAPSTRSSSAGSGGSGGSSGASTRTSAVGASSSSPG